MCVAAKLVAPGWLAVHWVVCVGNAAANRSSLQRAAAQRLH
jgi:hypothetical protein